MQIGDALGEFLGQRPASGVIANDRSGVFEFYPDHSVRLADRGALRVFESVRAGGSWSPRAVAPTRVEQRDRLRKVGSVVTVHRTCFESENFDNVNADSAYG